MPGRLSAGIAGLAVALARNAITIAGTSLTTFSFLFIVLLVVLGAFGVADGPYTGIVAFMILPVFFLVGLLLIPVGLVVERFRGSRPEGESAQDRDPLRFVLDLNVPAVRRALLLIVVFSFLNLFILSAVTYEGVAYMESNQFCGAACHSVMHPEYFGYEHAPHAEIKCVECHIGSGAESFVKAKLSGVRQVIALATDSYSRPIPTPVHNFRPAQEICGECHDADRAIGEKIKIITKFADDEENTKLTTAMVLHMGGGDGAGIHGWHGDADREIRFLATDESREEISLVRVREADGTVTNYASEAFEGDPASVPDADMRVMDCIDCHNRPAHTFETPGPALDAALASGAINVTLPSIKSAGLEALNTAVDAPDPQAAIAAHLQSFYADAATEGASVDQHSVDTAIDALQQIFSRNVFPSMEIGWGTYPLHDSHIDSPGCFRCHDDAHTSPAGEAIRQDCAMCHDVLAWDEPEPAVLEALGML